MIPAFVRLNQPGSPQHLFCDLSDGNDSIRAMAQGTKDAKTPELLKCLFNVPSSKIFPITLSNLRFETVFQQGRHWYFTPTQVRKGLLREQSQRASAIPGIHCLAEQM